MNTIIIRNIEIGAGIPKICVPIVEQTMEATLKEAGKLRLLPIDVVEWRVDWYEKALCLERVGEVLEQLRNRLGETPLLFTFRTKEEGGETKIDTATYIALNKLAAKSGAVDLLDVEMFSQKEATKEIISYAHERRVKVVGSNHDFHTTPEIDEIIDRLKYMRGIGADIPKIAVMPKCKKDVLALLEATEAAASTLDCPIITMSMSGMGMVSRLCGEVFGSAMTFGAVGKTSAPGQLNVEELGSVLKVIHENYN